MKTIEAIEQGERDKAQPGLCNLWAPPTHCKFGIKMWSLFDVFDLVFQRERAKIEMGEAPAAQSQQQGQGQVWTGLRNLSGAGGVKTHNTRHKGTNSPLNPALGDGDG